MTKLLKLLLWAAMTTKAKLPDGYTEIAGITMNDGVYYEIEDFKLKGSDTIKFSFLATASCNVIGAYSGSAGGNNFSLYVAVGGAGNYLRYKDGAYNSSIDADTWYDVTLTPTGSIGMKTDSTWTEKDFEATTNLCVGTTKTDASSAKLKGALRGHVVVEGRLLLIPCKRTSDSAIGYYSPQMETFYENQGSGTPTEYTQV